MNRKGFTMIELLMVIVIIGILSTIMIPNIMAIINKNKDNNLKILESNIISATKAYVNDKKYELDFNCPSENKKQIKLSSLVDEGYLKNELVDPNTKEKIDSNKEVTVTLNCNTKKFTYEFEINPT